MKTLTSKHFVVRRPVKVSRWHIIRDVPVAREQDEVYGGDGKLTIEDMRRIVRRMASFGPSALIIGHTGQDDTYDQKDVVGYATNYRLKKMNGVMYLIADFLVGDADILRRYPRRSIELWADGTIDPIALLGSETPKLDLPAIIIKYSRVPENTMSPEKVNDLVEAVLQALQNTAEWKFLSELLDEWEAYQQELQQAADSEPAAEAEDKAIPAGADEASQQISDKIPDDAIEKSDKQDKESGEQDTEHHVQDKEKAARDEDISERKDEGKDVRADYADAVSLDDMTPEELEKFLDALLQEGQKEDESEKAAADDKEPEKEQRGGEMGLGNAFVPGMVKSKGTGNLRTLFGTSSSGSLETLFGKPGAIGRPESLGLAKPGATGRPEPLGLAKTDSRKAAAVIGYSRDKQVEPEDNTMKDKYARLEEENRQLRTLYRRERYGNMLRDLIQQGYDINLEEELDYLTSLDSEEQIVSHLQRIRKYYRRAPVSPVPQGFVTQSAGTITEEIRDRAIEYAYNHGISFEEALKHILSKGS